MRIALPLSHGRLLNQPGCRNDYLLYETNPAEQKILSRKNISAPSYQTEHLPVWLARHGVKVLMACGMGIRARHSFLQQGIRVIVGVPRDTPDELVQSFLAGTLQSGVNTCEH